MRDFFYEAVGFFAFVCGILVCPHAVNRVETNVIVSFLSYEFWFLLVQGFVVILIFASAFRGPLVVDAVNMAIAFVQNLWSQCALDKALAFKLRTTKSLIKNMADNCKEPVTQETVTDPLILNCGHLLDSASYDIMSRAVNPSLTCPICRVQIQYVTKCYAFSCVVDELHKLKAMHGVA